MQFTQPQAPTLKILAPLSFPISLPTGDSVALILQLTAPSDTTIMGDTIAIASNDPEPGTDPYFIAITGERTSIRYTTNVPFPDTLFFGSIACGTSLDSAFTLTNLSSVPLKLFMVSSNPLFTTPYAVSVSADSGQSIIGPLCRRAGNRCLSRYAHHHRFVRRHDGSSIHGERRQCGFLHTLHCRYGVRAAGIHWCARRSFEICRLSQRFYTLRESPLHSQSRPIRLRLRRAHPIRSRLHLPDPRRGHIPYVYR